MIISITGAREMQERSEREARGERQKEKGRREADGMREERDRWYQERGKKQGRRVCVCALK
jgi:hypothetical protein